MAKIAPRLPELRLHSSSTSTSARCWRPSAPEHRSRGPRSHAGQASRSRPCRWRSRRWSTPGSCAKRREDRRPELRRRVLRADPGGRVRARSRPRHAFPARCGLRPRRRSARAPGRRVAWGRRRRARCRRSHFARSLVAAAALPVERIDGIVLGVPGVIDAATSTLRLTTPNIPGLEGRAFGLELAEQLGIDVTLENDVNLAAVGEHWAGVARGVDDFAFSPSAPAWAWVSSSAANCTAAITARRARWTGHSPVSPRTSTPRRTASRPWRNASRPPARPERRSRLPTTPARSSRPRGAATRSGERWSRRSLDDRGAHRTDCSSGRPCTHRPRRRAGHERRPAPHTRSTVAGRLLPYPPRVEISSLGEAAVLTGALAVGLRSASTTSS